MTAKAKARKITRKTRASSSKGEAKVTKEDLYALKLHGVSENNLKGFDLEIPHDEFTVVTGLSGSGKSSLAFSTIYAEGQRRYIETFSPYTRQFFDKVKKPELNTVENVRPAIAIQQRTRVTSSRSTVGSMTDVNDYLKVIWANLSKPYHPESGNELLRWTPSKTLADLEALLKKDAEVLFICAKIELDKKKRIAEEQLARMQMLGFSRVFNTEDGSTKRLEGKDKSFKPGSKVFFVIDRLRRGAVDRAQALDSIEQAFRQSEGLCLVIQPGEDGEWQEFEYSSQFSSPDPKDELDIELPLARPALFSFNSPVGACKTCRGFGRVLEIDPNKVIPDGSLSLDEGAIDPWTSDSRRGEMRKLLSFADSEGIPVEKPWEKLTKKQQELIFEHSSREFRGIRAWFKRLESKAYKMHVRVFLSRYRSQVLCPDCEGTRLVPGADYYKIDSRSLPELWETPVKELLTWVETRRKDKSLSRDLLEVFTALHSRLEYLCDLGLGYLTLGRESRTLSGGETQRVNLATALGSELVSTHFILDEPSVGLHPRDTERLLKSMRRLTDQGNSLLVVEHDLDCIEAADRVLEIGPEAGAGGGEVVFNAESAKWPGIEEKKTEIRPAIASKKKQSIQIKKARARNLKDLNFEIPCNQLVCLSGPSGSGKSTLVEEIILEAWKRRNSSIKPKENIAEGLNYFDEVLLVDQSGLAKSPRANIATYSKIWDQIRKGLAEQESAKLRSLDASSFSFNVEGGRCPECKGAGYIREDMQFLSDVYVSCEICLGKRFQDKVLEVQYLGKSASDWLETSVEACAEVFTELPKVRSAAETLRRLGLGHLRLGHPLSELSGGEAQRLKLVPYIQKSQSGRALLIFDEPTTGLHLNDVHRLIAVLQDLRDYGHSILCIEHNQELLMAADWVLDLGPDGGHEGGELVLEGPVSSFLKKSAAKKSLTAEYLQRYREDKSRLISGSRKKTSSAKKVSKIRETEPLEIVGAREHNLKNVSIKLPHDKFIAVTGVSGSGKSTIAKDIIYAEGQRRYLDCLSPYARQFIRELSKPEIDEIKNVRPTVCVYQHTFQPSKLSTVGTLSEAYNFLRLLFSKVGEQYCPDHPEELVRALSAEEIAEELTEQGETEVRLLARVINQKKGLHKTVFQRAIRTNIEEVRVDGHIARPAQFLEGLERNKIHTIEFVMGRFKPARIPKDLLVEAVKEAFAVGGGTMLSVGKGFERLYSQDRACPTCRRGFFRPDPEDLSFHSRRGRCQTCSGTGLTSKGTCKSCEGTRLRPAGRNVRLEQYNIAELCDLPAPEILEFLAALDISALKTALAAPIKQEVVSRLKNLIELGLDYLPLNRSCRSLSGGELQRLRLAAAMGTPLSGATYIFDEPSAGLHPSDNAKVLQRLKRLREQHNTVLLIEHDLESIFAAEHILELGPGGGAEGGVLTFNDEREKYPSDGILLREPEAFTDKRSKSDSQLIVHKGAANNVDVKKLEVPLESIVSFAGVSGAGKSSLLEGVILRTLAEGKSKDGKKFKLEQNELEIPEEFSRILVVDQQPIGKNSRSTPASYLKIWDNIRKLFAESLEAKSRGWGPGFFSYNSGEGRCPQCKGLGREKLEMSFLSEAFNECDLCAGRRYRDETLTVKYLEHDISQVLQLTFEEAAELFVNHPKIHRPLHCACRLGLGYLRLGQSSATLSGGESQRIKLVTELSRRDLAGSLYILDEPSIGLHRQDVFRLLSVLRELVQKGSSVFLIEHDEDVLMHSDEVIELGPGPDKDGGKIVFQGSPKKLASSKGNWGMLLKSRKGSSFSERIKQVAQA